MCPPAPRRPLGLLYVSTVTLAEICFGIELVLDANRWAELTAWLTHKVRTLFAQRVLEVSEDVLFKWRLLVERHRFETRVSGRRAVDASIR